MLNIHVAPVDDLAQARCLTSVTDSGMGEYHWAANSRDLIYVLDDKGNERWNVYRVCASTGQTANLTPNPAVRAFIHGISHRHLDEILVRLNDRDPKFHDLHRIHLRSGEDRLAFQNPGSIEGGNVVGFITDENYALRFVETVTADGDVVHFKPIDGGWERAESIPAEDIQTTSIEGFDDTGNVFYIKDSRGRDTAALYEVATQTGQKTLLAENASTDVGECLRHPLTRRVQAVSFTHLRKQWKVIDPAIRDDIEYLQKLIDGEMSITSRSRDDQTWIVGYNRPDGPVAYYLYRRHQQTAQILFHQNQELARFRFSKVRPVIIRSRDGLELPSYYILPHDCKRDGRPDRPLPTVLYVHGGPYGRDLYGFRDVHQWLADRGYAVLAVNFRGSTGFGKRFVNAANREWGGKMHDDLVDAVRWAIDARVADPKRIAIMGGSYGGYAALVGLTFTPDVFACSVAFQAISRLTTFLDAMPDHWKPKLAVYRTRIGDHTTEQGRRFLDSRSPLTFVRNICRPLLIAAGANDPRCPRAEADQIVSAMNAKGLPVTYCLYRDEGHGFTRLENRLSFFAVAEVFLSRHLGGTCESIGNDFQNASIQMVAGGEQIAGLA